MENAADTPRPGGADSSGIRVIARAADILFSLGRHPEGLSLREIARQVGLPRSTVQRIVSALEEANLVIAASAASGFRLGPAVTMLAASVRPFDIVSTARPLMQQLVGELGETVDLAIFAHGKAVVVDQISGTFPLLAVSAIGDSLPINGTASGKALLAALSPKELTLLREQTPLKPVTGKTTSDWEELEKELESVRETGLAFDHEEYLAGISAVATVLRGPSGELAAVSMPVPTERFDATGERLAKTLLERSQSLQRRL